MKIIFLATMLLSTMTFADVVNTSSSGKVITIQGGLSGTAHEAFGIISNAYEENYANYIDGKRFFSKKSERGGSLGVTVYSNPVITSSVTKGVIATYALTLKMKKKDTFKMVNPKTLKVSGEAATILHGAIAFDGNDDVRQIPGISRVESKSGKIVCEHPVVPKPVATCTIKL